MYAGSVVISCLMPDTYNLWVLSYFVVSLARGLSVILIFSKNKLFSFVFLLFNVIDSRSLLVPSFYLSWFIFCFFSPSFLRGGFIDLRLSLFSDICIQCYNFPIHLKNVKPNCTISLMVSGLLTLPMWPLAERLDSSWTDSYLYNPVSRLFQMSLPQMSLSVPNNSRSG